MRNKLGQFVKGCVSLNKGKKIPKGSLAKQGKNNPNYGKKYTKEEKEKFSKIAKEKRMP